MGSVAPAASRRVIVDCNLAGSHVEITGPDHHHLFRVLRLRKGQTLTIGDGKGTVASGVIEMINGDSARVDLSDIEFHPEPKPRICLALAVIKSQAIELAVRQATECGAAEIIPVYTERSIHWDDIRANQRMARLESIAKAASEQSRRAYMPRLSKPIALDILAGHNANTKVLFDPSGPRLEAHSGTSGEILATIGPEGGFTQRELDLVASHDFTLARLGRHILKAETAASVAVALLTTSYEA